jgi:hypothetical protein
MPFFYDLPTRVPYTSNVTAGTESTHIAGKNPAGGETLGLYGFYAASRFLTAGGAQIHAKTNTAGGTAFTGGTAMTPTTKNPRQPAAVSTWVNDASAITPGTTLIVRMSVGFAQTGGMGGYVPIVPTAAIQLTSATPSNPVDIEFTSDAASNSLTFDLSVDIGEGI